MDDCLHTRNASRELAEGLGNGATEDMNTPDKEPLHAGAHNSRREWTARISGHSPQEVCWSRDRWARESAGQAAPARVRPLIASSSVGNARKSDSTFPYRYADHHTGKRLFVLTCCYEPIPRACSAGLDIAIEANRASALPVGFIVCIGSST